MKLNTMRCTECHGEMALRTLAPMAGEEHGVRMQIEGMPAMECAKGHRRLVAPDFAVKLMEALLKDDHLVELDPASQKGLLRKRYCCSGCGKELADGATSHVEAKRVLELQGVDAFGVCVELPKYLCSACGRESIPPEQVVVADLMKASSHAFQSAQVSPG
jgi:DNA-directed RNA polymerase subunit RPC12/RpoP